MHDHLHFMKYLFIAFIFCLALDSASGQSITYQDSVYMRDHYDKVEFFIPMRDGKKLFTLVYIPRDGTST